MKSSFISGQGVLYMTTPDYSASTLSTRMAVHLEQVPSKDGTREGSVHSYIQYDLAILRAHILTECISRSAISSSILVIKEAKHFVHEVRVAYVLASLCLKHIRFRTSLFRLLTLDFLLLNHLDTPSTKCDEMMHY